MIRTGSAAASGFSLVEMVVIIILLGITGAVIFSRFSNSNSFNPSAAQGALLATIRTAQQLSLGRSNVTFEIDSSGGDWVFVAKAGGSTVREMKVSTSGVVLGTGSAVSSTDTCANSYDDAVASDFELGFDNKGNLTDFTNNSTTEMVGATFNGVRICVNDDVNFSLCVSPAGFAYAGNCDD